VTNSSIKTINPYNREVIETYNFESNEGISSKLEGLDSNFNIWRKTSINYRKSLISKVRGDLEENIEEYSKLITREMGIY